MCENRSTKVKPDMFYRLALRFVDSHSKGQTDRKLTAMKFKGKLNVRGIEGDVRDEDMFSSMVSTEQSDFQYSVGHVSQDAKVPVDTTGQLRKYILYCT
jgi:hypothetical protein